MNTTALKKLRTWMDQHGFERFFVQHPENFAWLSGGGDNTVVVNRPVAWLEVPGGADAPVKLHTSHIEARRLAEEEVPGLEVIPHPWYNPPHLPSPNDSEHDLTLLRLVLGPEEQERYRALGQDAARAIGEVMRDAEPEWTETELAGAVASALYAYGIQPVVLLAAGEERIFSYRHPLPKNRPLGRLAMAVLCGRRAGLIANVTRVKTWGHRQARALMDRVLQVEAAALSCTAPGKTLAEVFLALQQAYTDIGHPEALEEHHQGGLTGYKPREMLATPSNLTVLEPAMAVAWNPSLRGAKVEDTFLIGENGLENLTLDPRWPTVEVEGRSRPGLLEG
ncbi:MULTISPECIES: Xaa-Pro peptidase family protein [unclassified Meiothermus]|uniref:M24 family metallopeptidase n=1 Tax=unclassified Meiothermus TaxID=370471 RepID=UPI000D7C8805|nr:MULTISPECIES: M24 family metallopeptidase [unclassified Meiothermus]PZA07866.1 peptidase M24 [Meiothermus sp. Pnk-1]RYM38829.1 M24 family metallopeptidase [Meiothermus sp. PNK-Is4]